MSSEYSPSESVVGGAVDSSDRRRLVAAASVLLFGIFLIWGAAYANSSALHNAAHDARHSFAFPCH